MGYKFRWHATYHYVLEIQKSAVLLAKARLNIAKLNESLSPSFENLKKANIELTKLSLQTEKEVRKHSIILESTSSYKDKQVKDISSSIMYDIIHLIREIDSVVVLISRIIVDAYTVVYRENRILDRLSREVNRIKDENLGYHIWRGF